MDQEKIGMFIAELRKKKNMTQNDLAKKIGVTDRAISKWENGRGLPDISLIKPLCEELGISINELLSGERIRKDEYEKKFEENIIKTMSDSKKRIKKANIITYLVLFVIIVVVTFLTIFFIDMNRMKKGEKVFFSTWGLDYVQQVDSDDELMYNVIINYFVNEEQKHLHYEHEHPFISMKVMLVEEIEKEYIVYAWVLGENYYLENNEVKKSTGFSIPYKIVLLKNNDTYYIKDVLAPRDSPYYSQDLEELFPSSVRKRIDNIYYSSDYEELNKDIKRQVYEYFYLTTTSSE